MARSVSGNRWMPAFAGMTTTGSLRWHDNTVGFAGMTTMGVFEPPQILKSLVAQNKLGKKTGMGFYDWRSGVPIAKV